MKLLNGKLLINCAYNPEESGELDRVGSSIAWTLHSCKSSEKPLVPPSHHVSDIIKRTLCSYVMEQPFVRLSALGVSIKFCIITKRSAMHV